MTFEDVLQNGKLWAVVYDGTTENVLTQTLESWINPIFLRQFFTENQADLEKYFKITNLDQAIFDTITDAVSLSCVILDVKPDANLDNLFRPLENSRMTEMLLSREKAKGNRLSGHPSWLRIYAIKLEDGVYLVTGGTIKLTHLMRDRKHTLEQLSRMEMVRNHLLEHSIIDKDGLTDYNNTSQL